MLLLVVLVVVVEVGVGVGGLTNQIMAFQLHR